MSKQWSVSRRGWILRLRVIGALSFSIHQQCLPLEWLHSRADHLLHTMVPGSSRFTSSLHLMALSKCSPLTSVLHKNSGSDLSHGHFWTSHNIQETGIMYPPRVRWLTASFGRGMVAKGPERVCYQKRGDGIKEGAVRGSPFDLYYVYFISNKAYFIHILWVVTFEWAYTHNIYMSVPKG